MKQPVTADSNYFCQARERLMTELCAQGIDDEAVLSAMRQVPRHFFVGKEFSEFAYDNRALPIDEKQTISQPYIVAYMTQVIMRRGTPKKVLEIGTGSGYQTAILARLVASVFTVERIRSLHNNACRRLRELGFENIHFRCADGARGWKQYAPFDAVIVTAAAAEIAQALIDQLAVGGTLIAPVGDADNQRLVMVTRSRHHIQRHTLQAVKFVPLVS